MQPPQPARELHLAILYVASSSLHTSRLTRLAQTYTIFYPLPSCLMSLRTMGGSSAISSRGCKCLVSAYSYLLPRAELIVRYDRDEETGQGEEAHGHVVSISVLRSYRRLGLAKRLMVQSRTCSRCYFAENRSHDNGFSRTGPGG